MSCDQRKDKKQKPEVSGLVVHGTGVCARGEWTEAMADRKAELEKKRKKLDELRKARELKKAEAKDKEVVSLV